MVKQGFILSKRVIQRARDLFVELWVKTDDGPVKLLSEKQRPTCFASSTHIDRLLILANKAGLELEVFNDGMKTLEQIKVTTLKTHTEVEFRSLKNIAEANHITLFESDIKLADRYLMERFIYGSLEFLTPNHQSTSIAKTKVRPANYAPTFSVVSLDIECDEFENLYSIALASDCFRIVYLVRHSTHESLISQTVSQENPPFELSVVDNELLLLKALEQGIRTLDPDIILGWNIKQFDFSVLNRRANSYGLKLKLGRDNTVLNVREWESQTLVEIPGRAVVDGIESLKTMTYQFESFALDKVADTLLGDSKLIQSDNKLDAIKRMYIEDPIGLAMYNIKDCDLVNNIAKKTGFIDFLRLRATLTGLDLGRPGGSVAAFLNVYLPRMHRANYVSGVRPENGGLASPGGYVMRSLPGLYDNVLVLDFKSLYPSIIRTFKIDPVGLAEGLINKKGAIEGYQGAYFSNTTNFLPKIIAELWSERDEAKNQGDGARSQAIKILMNSFYGVLGSGGCPLYDPRLASSITLRGHDIMQRTAKWIEDQGYKVIYGDTDSTFVHIGEDNKHGSPDQTGKFLASHINRFWQRELREEFNIECFLELEYEQRFDKFFMPTIRGSSVGSKKRYAGLVQSNDGYHLVFKGLENVRSDWTQLARDFQYQLYEKVFTNQPISDFIKQTTHNLLAGKEDERLVYAKKLRKPVESYTKTVPPHVKAAKRANEQLKKSRTVSRLSKGDIVKYVITLNGPESIEVRTSKIDYQHYIEKQLAPIADSILPLFNTSFEAVLEQQLPLFTY